MKPILRTLMYPAILVALCAAFFYPTLFSGKLPVPTDTLIGLYHPWRDLYAPIYPRGVPYKNYLITDPVRQQIPWRKIVVDNLKQGVTPLWNPYNFSGTPLSANIQAGTWYPVNIFFLFMPFYSAWTVLIIIQPILAALFLYIYLRRKNMTAGAALFAGVVWAFCGFTIAWLTWGTIVQTALWLPLILLSIDNVLDGSDKRKRILWASLAAVSSVCTLFAGHAQIALYVYIVVLVYGIYKLLNTPKRKNVWWLLGAGISAVVVSSVQWIPMVNFLSHSSRLTDIISWSKEGWFLPWQNLVQFIAPDFFGNPATLNYRGIWNYGEFIGYIGILPMIFALYALLTRRDRLTRYSAFCLGIVLIFILPTPVAKIPYQFHLPVISSMQPTRLMVLVDICLSVLAGLGLDAYLRKPDKKIFYICGGLVLIFLVLWGYAYKAHLVVSKSNLILPGILLAGSTGILLLRRWKYLMVAAVIILTVFDLFRFGWKFTPFTPREYFFPATKSISFLQGQQKPFRVMSLDNRILPPNVSALYDIESVEGYDPIYDARYEEFIAAMNRREPDIDPPFGFNRIITSPSIDSPLFRLLNVRYVLSLENLKGPDLEFVYEEGQTKIYRYTKALPRIYAVESVVKAESKQNVMDMLYDKSFNGAKQAVVEGDLQVSQTPVVVDDHIDIVEDFGGRIRAFSSLANDHYVVITNIFDTGWKAYIDSKPSPVYRTNYVFQGINVPKGDHTILLKFER